MIRGRKSAKTIYSEKFCKNMTNTGETSTDAFKSTQNTTVLDNTRNQNTTKARGTIENNPNLTITRILNYFHHQTVIKEDKRHCTEEDLESDDGQVSEVHTENTVAQNTHAEDIIIPNTHAETIVIHNPRAETIVIPNAPTEDNIIPNAHEENIVIHNPQAEDENHLEDDLVIVTLADIDAIREDAQYAEDKNNLYMRVYYMIAKPFKGVVSTICEALDKAMDSFEQTSENSILSTIACYLLIFFALGLYLYTYFVVVISTAPFVLGLLTCKGTFSDLLKMHSGVMIGLGIFFIILYTILFASMYVGLTVYCIVLVQKYAELSSEWKRKPFTRRIVLLSIFLAWCLSLTLSTLLLIRQKQMIRIEKPTLVEFLFSFGTVYLVVYINVIIVKQFYFFIRKKLKEENAVTYNSIFNIGRYDFIAIAIIAIFINPDLFWCTFCAAKKILTRT